jgi:hypothetical protein
MPKTEIVELLNETLFETYNGLKTELDGFKNSHGDAPKSSAGDKHETSKAMADIEAEKLSQSLDRVKRQMAQLANIKLDIVSTKIGLGSLFKANNNWYFIAIAHGKFTTPIFGDVFVISSDAPIAKALNGKKIGDTAIFNNISFLISEIR